MALLYKNKYIIHPLCDWYRNGANIKGYNLIILLLLLNFKVTITLEACQVSNSITVKPDVLLRVTFQTSAAMLVF